MENFTMDSSTLGFLVCLLPVIIAVLLSFVPYAVYDRINNIRLLVWPVYVCILYVHVYVRLCMYVYVYVYV